MWGGRGGRDRRVAVVGFDRYSCFTECSGGGMAGRFWGGVGGMNGVLGALFDAMVVQSMYLRLSEVTTARNVDSLKQSFRC